MLLSLCLLCVVYVSSLDWFQITDSAPWVNRSGFAAVIFKDNIVITGGCNTSSIWQSPDGIDWEELDNSTAISPSPRLEFPTVVYNDSMISMGGCIFSNDQNTNHLHDVWSSKNGKTWININPSAPWTRRCTQQAVVFKNNILTMGGHAQNSTFNGYMNDVWSSNDGGTTWKELTSSAGWHKRDGFGVVVLNHVIYVFGGHSGLNTFDPAYNDVWKSDDGMKWIEITSSAPWVPRVGFQCTVWNDSIVILGGYSGNYTVLNDSWISKDGIQWIELKTNNTFPPTFFGAAVVFKNDLYIMSGVSSAKRYPFSDQNDVWVLK